MEVKRITLENIGLFESIKISLAPTERDSSNVTVFVGNNGAGKTSILQSLSVSLSWFIARLRTETGKGNFIAENAISNTANTATISVEVSDVPKFPTYIDEIDMDSPFKWALARTKKGRKAENGSLLRACPRLAKYYRSLVTILKPVYLLLPFTPSSGLFLISH